MLNNETQFGISRQPEPTCPEIDDVLKKIEGIRDHVSLIRSWGQEWKDMAIDLDDQLDKAKDEIRDLEKQVLKLEDQLSKVEEISL